MAALPNPVFLETPEEREGVPARIAYHSIPELF